MPQEQLAQAELSPEEAKASLGLSTRLSEQMLTQQAMMEGTMPMEGQEEQMGTAQGPKTAPASNPKPEEGTPESKMEMKNEIRTIVQEEMANLRQDIESALSTEDEEPK